MLAAGRRDSCQYPAGTGVPHRPVEKVLVTVPAGPGLARLLGFHDQSGLRDTELATLR